MNSEFVDFVERFTYIVGTMPLSILLAKKSNRVELTPLDLAGYTASMIMYSRAANGKRKHCVLDEVLTCARVIASKSILAQIVWVLLVISKMTIYEGVPVWFVSRVPVLTTLLKVATDLLLMWGKPVELYLTL